MNNYPIKNAYLGNHLSHYQLLDKLPTGRFPDTNEAVWRECCHHVRVSLLPSHLNKTNILPPCNTSLQNNNS